MPNGTAQPRSARHEGLCSIAANEFRQIKYKIDLGSLHGLITSAFMQGRVYNLFRWAGVPLGT